MVREGRGREGKSRGRRREVDQQPAVAAGGGAQTQHALVAVHFNGQPEPRQQRPEPWNILNPRIRKGEHLRAFPISNWTELDVWEYIARESIPLPSIYFSHRRTVIERDGMLLAVGGPVVVEAGEVPRSEIVRYRTVGDMSCTGAIESGATTFDEILAEVKTARITERGATRADDNFSESAMEDRKREGYF